MPKIQLSTLVSNIKGKSGGSVFARNKGGAYFRSAPTPVQTKTAEWNQQKVKFGEVSTQWKALTEQERTAWQTMAPSYPQTDAWGNTYVPSGYQLYMKLNTTLKSNGFPVIKTPESPTPLAISDDIRLYYPDNFAFTPTQGANLQGIAGRKFYLFQDNSLEFTYQDRPTDITMRFIVDLKSTFFNTPQRYASLFSSLSVDNLGVFAYIIKTNSSRYKLTFSSNFITINEAPKNRQTTYDITEAYNSGQFHLSFSYKFNDQDVIQTVYLNGVALVSEGSQLSNFWYNPFSPLQTYAFPPDFDPTWAKNFLPGDTRVGDYASLKSSLFTVSDFRVYAPVVYGTNCDCIDNSNCPEGFFCNGCDCLLIEDPTVSFNSIKYKLISKGYQLGIEKTIAPLNNYNTGQFPVVNNNSNAQAYRMVVSENSNNNCIDCVGNDVECINGKCVYVGDRAATLRELGVTFTPYVRVIPYAAETTSQVMNIFSTKPIGLGKSDSNNPEIMVSKTTLDGVSTDISDELQKLFRSMSPNSKLVLSYNVINGSSGESAKLYPRADEKKRKVIRFKAGSELSSSVN